VTTRTKPHRRIRWFLAAATTWAGVLSAACGADVKDLGPLAEPPKPISAAKYLQSLPKPHFRGGHTLGPLTRYGWTLPFEARVELAGPWGYAVEFGG